jgi:uncharacterized protein
MDGSSDGTFEGYASLFGTPDLGRDVVMPGAFRTSLARRGTAGVRMLWQHDPAQPIGVWLGLGEDARGLRVAGRLNLAVQRGRELFALMREGAVDGLSIGFRVERASPDRTGGLRRLAALDLWEVSLVTFPLLPGARVTRVAPASPAANDASADARAAALAADLRRSARRLLTRSAPPARAALRNPTSIARHA